MPLCASSFKHNHTALSTHHTRYIYAVLIPLILNEYSSTWDTNAHDIHVQDIYFIGLMRPIYISLLLFCYICYNCPSLFLPPSTLIVYEDYYSLRVHMNYHEIYYSQTTQSKRNIIIFKHQTIMPFEMCIVKRLRAKQFNLVYIFRVCNICMGERNWSARCHWCNSNRNQLNFNSIESDDKPSFSQSLSYAWIILEEFVLILAVFFFGCPCHLFMCKCVTKTDDSNWLPSVFIRKVDEFFGMTHFMNSMCCRCHLCSHVCRITMRACIWMKEREKWERERKRDWVVVSTRHSVFLHNWARHMSSND